MSGPRVSPVIDDSTGCHVWPGAVMSNGYGKLGRGGKTYLAHRWYWMQKFGPIPEGMQIDHLCRNRRCCNPDHMEVVTPRENIMRGNHLIAQFNRGVCKRGHQLTGDNMVITGGIHRRCRTCWNDYMRAFNARRREVRSRE